MATTGILNGTLAVIKVEGTAIAHLTSNEISFEVATRDTTTKSSAGNKEIMAALRSFKGSGSGYFAEDAAYGFEDLYTAMTARASVTVRWTTGVIGDIYYEGECIITSLSRTDGLEESSSFEVSFEGTGAVTKAAEA